MARKRSLLKPLARAPSEARHVFIIPGLGGHPLQFRPLASDLLPKIGLIGVLYPILAGDSTEVTSVEELASKMAVALDDVEGTVIICGHSFGGTVAYEVACQMRRKNRRVGVVLLDTAVGSLRRKRGRMFRGARNVFIAWPLKLVGVERPPPLQANQPQNPHSAEFRAECRVAGRNFKPARSDVPIVLIRAEARGRLNWLWSRYWPSNDYGWSKVAPVLQVIFCAGDHVTLVGAESRVNLSKAVDRAISHAYESASILPAFSDKTK